MSRFSLLGSRRCWVFGTLTLFGSAVRRTICCQLFRCHRSHAGIMPRLGIGFVARRIAFGKECFELLAIGLAIASFGCTVSRLTLLKCADTWASHEHLH